MPYTPRPPMGRPPMGRAARGVSLHVGLDRVDADKYGGWPGTLQAGVRDADAMRRLARAAGFNTTSLLKNEHATAKAVRDAIKRASEVCRAGDIFLLTFSGHGGQVPDLGGEETDARDETWVLYDRMLLDDELHAGFERFERGVRILIVADCCHSATSSYAVDPAGPAPSAQRRMIDAHALTTQMTGLGDSFRAIRSALQPAEPSASVLLLAACRDNETAMEDTKQGVFTAALLKVWSNGAFGGDYPDFRDAISKKVRNQSPQIDLRGGGDTEAFRHQRPFTVAPPWDDADALIVTDTATGRAITVTVRVELD